MSLLRRKVAATVALLSVSFASVTIGVVPPANAIINGSVISAGALSASGQFGWLVRLEGQGGCTGSLVAPDWVLTAAHCVGEGETSGITAFVGDAGTDQGVAIAEIVQHPEYTDDGSSEADLALMRLLNPVSRPRAALAGATDGMESDTEVLIAGWGVVESNGDVPTVPHQGVSVVTDVFAKVVVTAGPAVACSGDSGGPVLHNGVLVAVTSASDAGCATTSFSTRVSAHRAWITAVIGAVNQPPIATGGAITAAAGEPVEITFAFSDPDSDTAFIFAVDFDQDLLSLDESSCIDSAGATVCTFTPLDAFAGATEVSYGVADNLGATAEATWEITFVLDPTPPVAEDALVTVVAGRTTEVQLAAADINEDPFTFAVGSPPQHGSLSDCSAGTCEYTPAGGYTGPDSFTFTATDDGGLTSDPATVSIDVVENLPPDVSDFALAVSMNTATEIALAGSDPNRDAVVFTILDAPLHGTLDDCSTGFCTYTPSLDYEGADSFTFLATDTDGLESVHATVTIEIDSNFAPVAGDVTARTKAGLPVAITLDAFDYENDPIGFQLAGGPTHGTAIGCDSGTCTYTPNDGFSGIDTFTWTASDEFGTSQLAVATIDVAGRHWDVTPLGSAESARQLAAAVLQGDLTGNGSFTGATAAAGTFSGAADVIGIDAGIVLSSGRAIDVIGPNFDDARSTKHDLDGDATLFPDIDSFDAVALRYEVIPDSNELRFRYVLASDEYGDGGYMYPGFDDTAIISVGGQACGLADAAQPLPISVNSIRMGVYDDNSDRIDDPVNASLYVDNRFGTSAFDTEMDGFSAVLECAVDVVAGQAVVVTIAIADGGDGTIDSALLVEGNLVGDAAGMLAELRGMTAGLPKATSLVVKIDRATAAVEAGRIASACGLLKGFSNEVQALSGRKLPTATAAALIATAGRIATTLGCS